MAVDVVKMGIENQDNTVIKNNDIIVKVVVEDIFLTASLKCQIELVFLWLARRKFQSRRA